MEAVINISFGSIRCAIAVMSQNDNGI